MEKIQLEVSKRVAVGKRAKALREEGVVPGVLYGHGVKSEPVQVDKRLLEKVYHRSGGSKIVALKVGDGRARNVLIQDVQHNPTRGDLVHVDFYVVRMDEVLRAEVPIRFTGESTAVYQGEGTLMKNADVVEVECLPGDLPDSVEVDISQLDDFEKSVTFGDLELPAGVKLVADPGGLVVKVDPPRTDEEMDALDEAVNEAEELPEGVKEEDPAVVTEENEGDKDRGRDKK